MEQIKPKKCELMEAAFAADELRLFLDTHPASREALDQYREAAEKVRRAQAALSEPICALDAGRHGRWDWTETPWPWEMEA